MLQKLSKECLKSYIHDEVRVITKGEKCYADSRRGKGGVIRNRIAKTKLLSRQESMQGEQDQKIKEHQVQV